MSTIVCQGLQSCLEPRLIEPLILKHILANPKPNPTLPTQEENENKNKGNETETKNIKNNGNLSVWSFIQTLATPQTNPEKVYIHPVAKRSSSALSKQSLDMCTESLGSETGTYEFPCLSSIRETRERDQYVCQSRTRGFSKKMLRNRSFPPPLSSSHSVQVRPHRENGHLVLKAIAKTSKNNYFETERKNGRLMLSLMNENLYTDDELNVGSELKMVENIGVEIEDKNMCKEEENEKSGISTLGSFLMGTS